MNHKEYYEMEKDLKIANYYIGIFFIIAVTLAIGSSCSSKNICKEDIRLNGEVIYATPAPNCTRTVTLLTDTGYVKIYRVPIDQPLVNIPVCKVHGSWFWVMP